MADVWTIDCAYAGGLGVRPILTSDITPADLEGSVYAGGLGPCYEFKDSTAAPPAGRTTHNARQWGLGVQPGTQLQYLVGGRRR